MGEESQNTRMEDADKARRDQVLPIVNLMQISPGTYIVRPVISVLTY